MTEPESMPDDPFSSTFTAGTVIHEAFQSFIDAGFTREEAMSLVRDILGATMLKEFLGRG